MANPNNVLERFMAVVAMTIGSVTWAYIVGTMCALISALDRETAEFHHVMDKLNDFVVDRRLGPTLRDRLRTYFRERWTLSKANGYKELIDMMSPSLKGHVAAAATLEWLRKVSWMRKARLPFLHSVALSLEAQVYPPEELIPGDHFTLIMRGVAVKDVRVYISGNWYVRRRRRRRRRRSRRRRRRQIRGCVVAVMMIVVVCQVVVVCLWCHFGITNGRFRQRLWHPP